MPQIIVDLPLGVSQVIVPAEASNVVAELIGPGADGQAGLPGMAGPGGAGGWFTRKILFGEPADQPRNLHCDLGGYLAGSTINYDLAYAPGGASPSGVNIPASGYAITNPGGGGGQGAVEAPGTGGLAGSETGPGPGGITGGGRVGEPGQDATLPGQGGDGGGEGFPGGKGGPAWGRIIYDMPEPVEPEPEPTPETQPEPVPLSFIQSPQDTLIVRRGAEVIQGEALGGVVETLNELGLGV